MSRRVVRRAQARRDLKAHFQYLVAHADVATARRFMKAINSACDRLAEMPQLGAQREFRRPELANVRLWPVREFPDYLIFYEPMPGGMRVIRTIHAKADYWRVLEG